MTAAGLVVGAALALALLCGAIEQTLRDPSWSRRADQLSATTWLLGGTFLTLVIAQLAHYLR